MKKTSARGLLTTTALSAATLLVAGSALSASASSASGTSGLGGGVFAGDTLVATAWEGAVDPYTAYWGSEVHPESLDVYNYRIGLLDGTLADVQATTGLHSLTEAEQEQWYVDAGLAPYDFDWLVFYCPALAPATSDVPATTVATDPSINLDQIVTRTVEDAPGYSNLDSSDLQDWFDSVASGLVFEPEIPQSDYVSANATNVQTRLFASDESFSGQWIVQAASYLDFSCPDTGNAPQIGRILKTSTFDDFAVDRTLTIGSTLYFQPYITLNTPTTVYEIPTAGTYIATTGRNLDANAALWGVTHVNDGARALPNTGADASAMWAATAGAVMLAAAGALLVGIRRKTAR